MKKILLIIVCFFIYSPIFADYEQIITVSNSDIADQAYIDLDLTKESHPIGYCGILGGSPTNEFADVLYQFQLYYNAIQINNFSESAMPGDNGYLFYDGLEWSAGNNINDEGNADCYFLTTLTLLIEEVESSGNPITQLANNTASGSIAEAGTLMDGPIGYIVYFVIGLFIIVLVIAVIKKFF